MVHQQPVLAECEHLHLWACHFTVRFRDPISNRPRHHLLILLCVTPALHIHLFFLDMLKKCFLPYEKGLIIPEKAAPLPTEQRTLNENQKHAPINKGKANNKLLRLKCATNKYHPTCFTLCSIMSRHSSTSDSVMVRGGAKRMMFPCVGFASSPFSFIWTQTSQADWAESEK